MVVLSFAVTNYFICIFFIILVIIILYPLTVRCCKCSRAKSRSCRKQPALQPPALLLPFKLVHYVIIKWKHFSWICVLLCSYLNIFPCYSLLCENSLAIFSFFQFLTCFWSSVKAHKPSNFNDLVVYLFNCICYLCHLIYVTENSQQSLTDSFGKVMTGQNRWTNSICVIYWKTCATFSHCFILRWWWLCIKLYQLPRVRLYIYQCIEQRL